MKKNISIILILMLWFINPAKAADDNDKLLLKCESPYGDYLAVIDFKNGLFDAARLDKGMPEKLSYQIDEVNDKKITAVQKKVTTYTDGSEVIWLITITIDRHLATIRDKGEKIKDTRKNISESGFRFAIFELKNCHKFNTTKVF